MNRIIATLFAIAIAASAFVAPAAVAADTSPVASCTVVRTGDNNSATWTDGFGGNVVTCS